jgi:AAA15 family ATPase/GTPase
MRIREFEGENKVSKWKLEKTKFSDLTLLVGISGVGKTRILESIRRLKSIADGKAINGAKWNITFDTNQGDSFCWTGEFEGKANISEYFISKKDSENKDNEPRLLNEKLIKNGKIIVERVLEGNSSTILLNDKPTPKLASNESVLSILKEEDDISSAYNSFKRIKHSDFSDSNFLDFDLAEYAEELETKKDLASLKDSTLDTPIKIALLYNFFPNEFQKIKQRFIEIFPQIEDVCIKPLEDKNLPVYFEKIPFLQIKEQGVENWIPTMNMSAGMFKTFMHISELFLLASGTVVLIDEFENSLGVNCINVLTEDLLQESRNLQFIVTSHHPYIINKIATKHWKIVSRKGGVVKTQDVEELNLPKSKHEAFLQLLNLEEFVEGIAI